MSFARATIFVMLLAVSGPLTAGTLVLTEGDGRPLAIETADVGALEPTELGGQAVVDEFSRLCLPTPVDAYAKAASSVFHLEAGEAILPAIGKIPEARVPVWRGYSAKLAIWNGDDASLSKRPVSIPSRAYVVNSQYGPFRAVGEQCNLVVKVRDFAAATQIVEALTAKFGPAGKLVAKKTWADGFWLLPNSNIRLNFTTPSTDEGARPIYLSSQILGKEGNK